MCGTGVVGVGGGRLSHEREHRAWWARGNEQRVQGRSAGEMAVFRRCPPLHL